MCQHVPGTGWNFYTFFIYAFIPNISYTPVKQTCKGNLLMGEKTRGQMTQCLAQVQSQQISVQWD